MRYNTAMPFYVTEKLLSHLSPAMQVHLEQIRVLATSHNTAVYIVGGLVRDLLLGQGSHDLDIVLEGSGLQFAQAIQQKHGGQVTLHPRFGTATWWPTAAENGEIVIDFITARSEAYPQPGALPVTQPATLVEDLARRDYTLNALAVRLDDPHFGTLIDLHGGFDDLQAGRLRVLHPRSFQDDATRIWRGVRYEQRLGFEFEKNTAVCLNRDLDYLRTISGDRIRHELALILLEPNRAAMLARLAELGVLPFIAWGLRWMPEVQMWFGRASTATADLPDHEKIALYLALWLLPQEAHVRTAALHYLRPDNATQATVTELAAAWASVQAANWTADTPPSVVAQVLLPYKSHTAVLRALTAVAGTETALGQLLHQYETVWRYVAPTITGHTLREMGLSPGPRFRELLTAVLNAKLDGHIHTPADERNLAHTLMQQLPQPNNE